MLASDAKAPVLWLQLSLVVRNRNETTMTRSLTNGDALTTELALGLCRGVLGGVASSMTTSRVILKQTLDRCSLCPLVPIVMSGLALVARTLVLSVVGVIEGLHAFRCPLIICDDMSLSRTASRIAELTLNYRPVATSIDLDGPIRVTDLPATLANMVLAGATRKPMLNLFVMFVNVVVTLVSGRWFMSVNVVVLSGTRIRQLVLEVISEMTFSKMTTHAKVFRDEILISP